MKAAQMNRSLLLLSVLFLFDSVSAHAAGPNCKNLFEVISVKRSTQDLETKKSSKSAEAKRKALELEAKKLAWSKLTPAEKRQKREEFMMTPAKDGKIERRPFWTTTGLLKDAVVAPDPADKILDTADPSLVMPITYPNGVTRYRKNFSGGRWVEGETPESLFVAGPKKIHRSKMYYKNGAEMTGAYHIDAFPWDVVIYKNDAGEWIALGGVMELKDGKLPTVQNNNPTRSRWWGSVEHVEVSPGVFEEHITWQEPIHDFNRNKHKGWEYHGYGGTLVTEYNPVSKVHEPVKNENGNYILMYERVTQEKYKKPWMTTTMMREMDPSLKSTVGPEIEVTNLISPKTGQLFAALRRGSADKTTGHLREGDNVFKDLQHNQFIKTGSANDYTREYGIYIDYREPGEGPVGMYKNVVDKDGELIDFAATLNLRDLFGWYWVGRPQTSYDPNQQIWISGHSISARTMPKGANGYGFPTAKKFPYFGRSTWEFPVKIVHDKNGQPRFVADIDPEWAYMFEEP